MNILLAILGIIAAYGSIAAQAAYLTAINSGQRGTLYLALAAILCTSSVIISITLTLP